MPLSRPIFRDPAEWVKSKAAGLVKTACFRDPIPAHASADEQFAVREEASPER
jgi:hypothetical protein